MERSWGVKGGLSTCKSSILAKGVLLMTEAMVWYLQKIRAKKKRCAG
jgi:hypothetical protein